MGHFATDTSRDLLSPTVSVTARRGADSEPAPVLTGHLTGGLNADIIGTGLKQMPSLGRWLSESIRRLSPGSGC